MNEDLKHLSVLLEEIISYVPVRERGFLLDVTAGGGGHFSSILALRPAWDGECWDRDPEAESRVRETIRSRGLNTDARELNFKRQSFGAPTNPPLKPCDFILADIGVSSFQLDDPARGMSLRSDSAPDFRMDPESGLSFAAWLGKTNEFELARILQDYGEEPRAKKVAREMKSWGPEAFASAAVFADRVKQSLSYGTPSRIHPATRVFQALRIAINDELGELERLLEWAPTRLAPGGRLAIISFHSLEDRIVKNAFRALAAQGEFDILTKKPVVPSETEAEANPRSRSAKLRVLERRSGVDEGRSLS